MVRKYKRKSNRQQWKKREIVEAVNAIVEKGMSIKIASHKFNIPKTTLTRWCKKAKDKGIEFCDARLGRHKNVFTEEQEMKFKQYIKNMHLSLFQLSAIELRKVAFEYAELNRIPHTFNVKTGLAGQDWYTNFVKRCKTDEKNRILFGKLNNSYNLDQFFESLSELQQAYKFSRNQIYHVDDSMLISIPDLTSRIYSAKDESEFRMNCITVITCSNAAGDFIPPLMVFPSDNGDSEFINGCPPGTEIVCHPTGRVQNEIFCPLWFNHFLKHARQVSVDPLLLLLNGQSSYVKNLSLVEKAKVSNTNLLSIPMNEQYKLHPLESYFMESLKQSYCEEEQKWKSVNKCGVIDLRNVGEIFGIAYAKAATTSNAAAGFKDSNIYSSEEDGTVEVKFEALQEVYIKPFIKPETGSCPDLSTSADNISRSCLVAPSNSGKVKNEEKNNAILLKNPVKDENSDPYDSNESFD